jgi:hypothetical protein
MHIAHTFDPQNAFCTHKNNGNGGLWWVYYNIRGGDSFQFWVMNFWWVWMANVWPNLIPNAQIVFSFLWFVHFHMSMTSTLKSLSYSYFKALSHPFNTQNVELKKMSNAFKSFVVHCIMTSFWGCTSLDV